MPVRKKMPRPYRKPTYGAGARLARIVLELTSRPHGWSFEAIQEELRISDRTLQRYLQLCRSELLDRDGHQVIEVIRRGERRLLRLAENAPSTEAGVYEAVFLYFTLTVLAFLEGTVLKEGADALWERFHARLPAAQRVKLAHLRKKFWAVPHAVKDYRDYDDTLDLAVRCLVNQERVRVDYQGLMGEGKVHTFDPYTLVAYRGGLYLIGYSHRFRKIIWLAIERIRGVTKVGEHFDYPTTYSPESYTQGTFGIWDGPETKVEILLLNPETRAFLESRRLHPTQRFQGRKDGTSVLSMQVRGTTELVPWVLSLTPYVEVLKPTELRREVAERLVTAATRYGA